MPETKLQDIVFSIMMAVTMVYAMELYNLSVQNGSLVRFLFRCIFPSCVSKEQDYPLCQ